jgi:hypothetical protein
VKVSPLTAARGIAVGRLAFGAAMLAAPGTATRGWIGAVADEPGGQAAVRALGIRDAILGAITLHTLSHPEVGPRWVAMCGLADSVDFAATYVSRQSLPSKGIPTLALAGGAAAVSFALAGVLKQRG